MFEFVDRAMLAGLGALSMSREKAEKLFDEYVNRGKVEREGRTGFVKEVMDTVDKTRSELEEIVSKQVNKAVSQMNLATKDDIERVESKLDQLLNKE